MDSNSLITTDDSNLNTESNKSDAFNGNPACVKTPLREHVYIAVCQYFDELEEQLPTSLYQTVIQEVEKPLLEVVLNKTQGNQSKSAKILGLNRGTLRKKLETYGLM